MPPLEGLEQASFCKRGLSDSAWGEGRTIFFKFLSSPVTQGICEQLTVSPQMWGDENQIPLLSKETGNHIQSSAGECLL